MLSTVLSDIPAILTSAGGMVVTVNNNGSGNAHNNLQPYQVVNYIIKVV